MHFFICFIRTICLKVNCYKELPLRVFQRMLQAGSYDFNTFPWMFQRNSIYLQMKACEVAHATFQHQNY